jgi:hypothetical protein
MPDSVAVAPPGYADVAPDFECPLCGERVTARMRPSPQDFYVPPHDEECAYFMTDLQRAIELRKLSGRERERDALIRAMRRENSRSRPGRL